MLKRKQLPIKTGHFQRGVATLLVSLVVLTTITFISLYTARTVLMEQKISTNEYRSRLAFEAAEAGIERAISFITDGRDPDDDNLLSCHAIHQGDCGAGRDTDEFLFDSDSDGVPDTNTFNLLDSNNRVISSVTVSLVNADAGDIVATEIIATGRSDDGAASRTVNEIVAMVHPLPNTPENPLTTQGTVVIGGSATVHNPEGNSTIWSGGDVDLGSNNSTSTKIANPASANYPDCLGDSVNSCDLVQASDRYIASLDIIEYDSSLSNLSEAEFFENFFGRTPEVYRKTIVKTEIDIAAGDDINQIHLATGDIIWVEGDVTISGLTIGCTVAVTGSNECEDVGGTMDPSTLIINGDLTLSGGPQFYGLVYVAGNVNISGNATMHGAVVTQGAATNTTGSLDIYYNSDLLEDIAEDGPPAGGGGGWRDFEPS